MRLLTLKKENRWSRLIAVSLLSLGILGAIPLIGPSNLLRACQVDAATYATSEFCYATNVTITNSGGVLTNRLVRLTPIRASTMISSQYMSAYADDVLLVDSSSTDRQVTTQDLSSTTAPWWVLIPTIPASSSVNLVMYSGSYRAHRTNGMTMNGDAGTYVTVAHNGAFNLTNNFRFSFFGDSAYTNATTAWLVSHFDSAGVTGYRLGTYDSGAVKYVRAQVDGQTCDAVWTGINTKVDAVFQTPNLYLYFNDVLQNTCNTGLASVSTNTQAFQSGVAATGTGGFTGVVHYVQLASSYSTTNSIVLNWLFAAKNKNGNTLTETQAPTGGNGYTALGTVTDVAGSFNGTYHIVSSQANLTITIGSTYSNVIRSGSVVSQQILGNVLPTPVGPTLAAKFNATPVASAGNNLPFMIGTNINGVATATGGSPQAVWFFFAGVVAIIMMAVSARVTHYASVSMAMPTVVFLGFAFLGPLSPWIALVTGLVSVAFWMLLKVGQF